MVESVVITIEWAGYKWDKQESGKIQAATKSMEEEKKMNLQNFFKKSKAKVEREKWEAAKVEMEEWYTGKEISVYAEDGEDSSNIASALFPNDNCSDQNMYFWAGKIIGKAEASGKYSAPLRVYCRKCNYKDTKEVLIHAGGYRSADKFLEENPDANAGILDFKIIEWRKGV